MDFYQFLKDGDPENCCQRDNISYEISSVEQDENLTPSSVPGLILTNPLLTKVKIEATLNVEKTY